MRKSKSRFPKFFENLFLFFPALNGGGAMLLGFAGLRSTYWSESVLLLLGAVAWLYLLPPITWRILNRISPLHSGLSYLGPSEQCSTWILANRTQNLFNALPGVEKILLLFPEAYSAWLRLWGSTIGRRVTWASEFRVRDRTHLVVGDAALIGNHSYLSCHVVDRRKERWMLYFKPIEIGPRVLVGAWAVVSPGTKVEAHASIPAGSQLKPNTVWKKEA